MATKPKPYREKPKKVNAITERRARVGTLLLQGYTYRQMAKMLNVSSSQIGKDVTSIRKQWVTTAILEYDQHIAQELERLNQVIAAAWEGWELSKQKATRTKRKGKAEKPTNKDDVERISYTAGAGSPRFLEIIIKAHERICALMGLNAAHKIELSGPGGGPIEIGDAIEDAKTFYIPHTEE